MGNGAGGFKSLIPYPIYSNNALLRDSEPFVCLRASCEFSHTYLGNDLAVQSKCT